MNLITYTPENMNVDHLRIEMLLSSLLQPHTSGKSHTIVATDEAIVYTYKSDNYGKIMTGQVVSLRKPTEHLRIIDLDGVQVDEKRIAHLRRYLKFEE